MRITKELAFPIIQKLTNTMNYNMNIMDDQGVIIAAPIQSGLIPFMKVL